MNKRGVSAIIATVLLVVIVIAAAGIVYTAVIPLIKGQIEAKQQCSNVGLQINTVSGYTCYDEANKEVLVQIQRGTGEVNLTGIQVNVEGGGMSKNAEIREYLKSNFLKNAGFEKGFSNWTSSGNPSPSIVASNIEGKSAVYFPKGGSITAGQINVNGLNRISISAYVKKKDIVIGSCAWCTAYLLARWVNASGQDIYGLVSPYTNYPDLNFGTGTADWKRYSTTFNVPPNAVGYRFLLGISAINATPTSGEMWLDAIKIEEGVVTDFNFKVRDYSEEYGSLITLPKTSGESRTYAINIANLGITNPEKISAAPIIKVGTSEKPCDASFPAQLEKCG